MRTELIFKLKGWIVTSLIVASLTSNLSAAVVIWTNNSGDGLASNGNNWDQGFVPTQADSVLFTGTFASDCIIDADFQVAQLMSDESYQNQLIMQQGVTADVAGGMTILGGTLQGNNGDVTVGEDLNISPPGKIIGGSGSLTVGGNLTAQSGSDLILGNAPLELTAATGNVVVEILNGDTLITLGLIFGFPTGSNSVTVKNRVAATYLTLSTNAGATLEKGGAFSSTMTTSSGSFLNVGGQQQMVTNAIFQGGGALYLFEGARLKTNYHEMSGDGTLLAFFEDAQMEITDSLSYSTTQNPFSYTPVTGSACLKVAGKIALSDSYTYPAKLSVCFNPNVTGDFNEMNDGTNGSGSLNCTACVPACSDNVLSGVVSLSGGGGVDDGVLRAYVVDDNGILKLHSTEQIGAAGTFNLSNVPSGHYVLWAKADSSTYPSTVPTYSNEVLQWQKIKTKQVSCADSATFNFTVMELPVQFGTGKIAGNVFVTGTNKTTSDPIPGLDIVLEKIPPPTVVGHTTTNNQGAYEFINLEDGTYIVYVDMPGVAQVQTYTLELEDGVSNNEINKNFFADSIQGITIIDVSSGLIIPTEILKVQLIGHQLVISSQQNWHLQLSDAAGRLVHQSTGAGNHVIPHALNGLYIMNLSTSDGLVARQKVYLR